MMTDSRGTGLQQWTKKNSAKFSEHISDFEAEDKKIVSILSYIQ